MIDGRLLSPYIPCRWEGRVMHAICYPANSILERGRGWLAEPHESPHPDCRCGIYAYHRPGTQTYFGEWEWTEGIVTAWGRIEAHAAGLRAQHARVEALGLPPSNEPTRRRSGRDDRRSAGGSARPPRRPRRGRARPMGRRSRSRCCRRHDGTMVQDSFPILSVADLGRAQAFYRDLLGGTVGYAFPPEGEPQFVTSTSALTLGLGATTGGAGPHAGTGYTLCAYVADCDAAVDAVRAAGHTVGRSPSDQPWGERIARVLDADGYEVLLVARL